MQSFSYFFYRKFLLLIRVRAAKQANLVNELCSFFLCSTVLIRTLREFDIDNALRRKPLFILVRERIPDSIFDKAAQVELVDIEPAEGEPESRAGEILRFLLWKRLPMLK